MEMTWKYLKRCTPSYKWRLHGTQYSIYTLLILDLSLFWSISSFRKIFIFVLQILFYPNSVLTSSPFSWYNEYQTLLIREASENSSTFSQRVVKSLSLSGLVAEVAGVVGNGHETPIAFPLTCTVTRFHRLSRTFDFCLVFPC